MELIWKGTETKIEVREGISLNRIDRERVWGQSGIRMERDGFRKEFIERGRDQNKIDRKRGEGKTEFI